MLAIFKREFNSYFTSPIGYVFIAMFYFISGIFFFLYNLAAASAELRYVYSMLFTCSALLMPILTMRMLSEDKRQKTDQILLTSPVSLTGLLMGKFLAAFFGHGQGIHIRPEEDAGSAFSQLGGNAIPAVPGLQSAVFQHLFHIGFRHGQIQSRLGVPVEIPPVGNGFLFHLTRTVIKCHGQSLRGKW